MASWSVPLSFLMSGAAIDTSQIDWEDQSVDVFKPKHNPYSIHLHLQSYWQAHQNRQVAVSQWLKWLASGSWSSDPSPDQPKLEPQVPRLDATCCLWPDICTLQLFGTWVHSTCQLCQHAPKCLPRSTQAILSFLSFSHGTGFRPKTSYNLATWVSAPDTP